MDSAVNTFNIAILVLVGLVTAFFAVIFYYYRRHRYHTGTISPRVRNSVFLEIQMPKEANKEEKERPKSEEEKKLIIAVAEQLYTTLSAAGDQHSWWKDLFHHKDYFTLEIACVDKKISFYVNCPKHLQELIEKQIQAQYPHAFIEQIKGYNPFQKGGQVECVELQQLKKYVYPTRTYKNMESDPLNALTNAMSKLDENEGAVIQYVLSPAGTHWQGHPRHMALEIQQGKHPGTVEKGMIYRTLHEFTVGMFRLAMNRKGHQQGQSGLRHLDLSGSYSPIQLTPMQQEIVKRLEEKASRPGYKTNIRIISSSTTPGNAKLHLNNIVASFLQYNMPPFNGFKIRKRAKTDILKDFIFRIFRDYGKNSILNTEELTSLWHLPTPYIETPNIKWLVSRKAPPPINMPKQGILLGRNIYRGVESKVYIQPEDRMRHVYIIGRSGSGKTEIMKYMSVQDIKNGEGLCIIDPHGDFIEDILPHIPKERAEDVILFFA
jgi:hypothetical protein